MQIESIIHPEGILLTLPPSVALMRVRFQGGQGRGRIQLEFCNRRARRVATGSDLDEPRIEEQVLRLLDREQPGWANGPDVSGSLLIDLATGESRIEAEST